MNEQLRTRLEAIQESLAALHRGGQGLPSPMAGAEREAVLDRYLREILPPVYRFGRGTVIDSTGAQSGALDLVMELPFAPNFPMLGGGQRLYLAEAVGAVIEVKSNLSAQWKEVEPTVHSVKQLRRDLRRTWGLLFEDSPDPPVEVTDRIPCYAVGYTGYATCAALGDRLNATSQQCRPDGVLAIDSGAFVGGTGQGEGAVGLYYFVAELVAHVNVVLGIAYPQLQLYL